MAANRSGRGNTNGSVLGTRGTRGTQEIVEAQREGYEALADNFAAFGQQGMEFAEGGLEVLKLQENSAKATQEWFANGVRLLELQQRNARFVRNWFSGVVGLLQEQAERNQRTAEVFAESARKQREGFRKLTEDWSGAYREFFSYSPFSPYSYMREGFKAAEQVSRQGLEATQQATRQGLRVAEEAAEQTGRAIEQAEEVTRQAELRAIVAGALKTTDYEKLSVDEVSAKLDDLSVSELEKVREYEKRGHDRQSLVGQIDQKIRANS